MATHKVYQTLEDKENVLEVERHGPYLCKSNSAWLGRGYYFWDYHIELAHWWGKQNYSQPGYIICQTKCELNSENCWDLHSNGKHQSELCEAYKLLINSGIANKNEITVAQVIEYAKQLGFFKYFAIRSSGINSAKEQRNEINVGTRLIFNNNNKIPYLDLYPQIQICIINKEKVQFGNFKVIFPDCYNENYVF